MIWGKKEKEMEAEIGALRKTVSELQYFIGANRMDRAYVLTSLAKDIESSPYGKCLMEEVRSKVGRVLPDAIKMSKIWNELDQLAANKAGIVRRNMCEAISASEERTRTYVQEELEKLRAQQRSRELETFKEEFATKGVEWEEIVRVAGLLAQEQKKEESE